MPHVFTAGGGYVARQQEHQCGLIMTPTEAQALFDELQAAISGDVRCDALARALYATDASIYEIVPDMVVLPRTVADVCAAVRICAKHGVPITPRGAGTGLTGGVTSRGAVLDFTRYMNRIGEIDVEKRTVRIEPGVVLDELNAELKRHGLHFSPDVATANCATIGGMIGNNSAGAHSIVAGCTCDHVLGVDMVLSDGSVHTWGKDAPPGNNPLARRCDETLGEIARDYAQEIEKRFPKTFRCNGGYALHRLKAADGRINTEQIIVGSEGTLGAVTGAVLNLLPLPKHRGMAIVHFADLLESLKSIPAILEHKPAAIELVDKLILDGTKNNQAMERRRWFLDGDPEALLIVELFDDSEDVLGRRLDILSRDLQSRSIGYSRPVLVNPAQQADVWEVRKAGTGLLMSRPGDMQTYDFVDDCAVDPAKLHDYIARLQQILADENIERTGYYAHASAGLLHVRPALNLKTSEGVEKLRRISDRVSRLVQEFEGSMTGEHGEGIARSEWIERLFGTKLVEAFRKIKTAFDPNNIFNPNKIIDPLPMDSNLRYGADYETRQPQTVLDFSVHGGLAGAAEMCRGLGECRKRLVGVMCPSYQVTGDETHSTRARANALREALSNRELLDGLADPGLAEVFDLCLSCKACKTECPTGTDVAKLKTEWLHAKNKREGTPRRSRLIARTIHLAAWGSRFAPLSNWIAQSKIARAFIEHWFGLDRRVPSPKYARETFRQWYAKHMRPKPDGADSLGASEKAVVYFVDTWVNCYLPQVGQAAIKVLEALGHEVVVPDTVCCGRPLISKGLLDEAKSLAEDNVEILAPYAERGVPIVGTEPSCVSVLQDELPQFVRTPAARQIAQAAQTIEVFVSRALKENPNALKFKNRRPPILYHGHCHQKALTGTTEGLHVLNACTHGAASEINSGCCGMAGAFGHEVEHSEIAQAIGEQRLFPAIRERGEAEIAVSGFSCRCHINNNTDARPLHVIEHLAAALA